MRTCRERLIPLGGDARWVPHLVGPGHLRLDAEGHRRSRPDGDRRRGGTDDELSPSSALFMEPFVTELISAGVVSGAGESLASDEGFVAEPTSNRADDSSVAPS